MPPRRLTRRQAIVLGAVGVPVASLTGLALRHAGDPGGLVTAEERRGLSALNVREFATLKAAMMRIAASDGADFPSVPAVNAAAWAERYLAGLAAPDLRDFKSLLGALEHVFVLRALTTLPFSRASHADQDAVLAGLETSSVETLRVAFAALKQVTAMAFFRHPDTFRAIGYEGPRVPPAGASLEGRIRGAPVPRAEGVVFDVDAVVVGAGAGGSMAARELARAGARVLLLEEGPDHTPESFTQREDEMLSALYQDRGGRATKDRAIVVLQGRGLGGSTIHNQNLCKRAPAEVLDGWRDAGLAGWDAASMAPLYDEVERDLHVTDIAPWQVNAHNEVFRRGATALGWRAASLRHNRDGCVGSGFCELGCAYDGKNNARKSVIPAAVLAGAQVRPETRVERVLVSNGRATGVQARDARTGAAVLVRARAVVLAGSAVGSAFIAISSGIADPYDQLGRGLRLHPAGVVAGVFDESIAAWRGVPQSWECTEFLRFERGSERRVWILPVFAHPVGTAAMTPGVGVRWTDAMRDYPRMAVATAMVHDETEGRVRVERGRVSLDYTLGSSDRMQLARGMRACGELLLAAGARAVMVPFAPPLRASRASELNAVNYDRVAPHALPLTAVHPQGAMRAGSDPRRSVCDPRGAHHHVRGLYVADGGLFPTSLGVPPQISIYTVGMKVGRAVAEDLRRA